MLLVFKWVSSFGGPLDETLVKVTTQEIDPFCLGRDLTSGFCSGMYTSNW